MKNELSASQKVLLQKLPKGTKTMIRLELKKLFLKANKDSKRKAKFIERLFETYDPSDFTKFKGVTQILILKLILMSPISLTEQLFVQLSHLNFSDKDQNRADKYYLLLSSLLLGDASAEAIREIFPVLSKILNEQEFFLYRFIDEINMDRNFFDAFLSYFLDPISRKHALELYKLMPDNLALWHRCVKIPSLSLEVIKDCLSKQDYDKLEQLIRKNLPMIKLLSPAYPNLSDYTPTLSYDLDSLQDSTIQALSKLYGICTSCELTEPIYTHRMAVIPNDVFLVDFSSFKRLQIPSSSDLTPDVRHSMIQDEKKNLQFRFHSPQSAYEVINHPVRDKFKIFPLNLKRLSKQIEANPFMISFFQNLFIAFGESAPIFHQLAPYFIKKNQFRISLSMNDCWKYETFEGYLQNRWKIEGELLDHLASLNFNDADLIASCVPLIKRSNRVHLLQIFETSRNDEGTIPTAPRKQLQKEFLMYAIGKSSAFKNKHQEEIQQYVSGMLSSKTPINLKMTPYELRNALKDKDQID